VWCTHFWLASILLKERYAAQLLSRRKSIAAARAAFTFPVEDIPESQALADIVNEAALEKSRGLRVTRECEGRIPHRKGEQRKAERPALPSGCGQRLPDGLGEFRDFSVLQLAQHVV
jgi:hypothetical protein